MANIENELNQINTAIYGKDVRSSLVNGLEAINTEVNLLDSKVANFAVENKNAVSISENAQNIASNTQNVVENVRNEMNTVSNNVNEALSTAKGLMGKSGLPSAGGNMTGPINLTGNGTIEYEEANILSVDSNNNLWINYNSQLADTMVNGILGVSCSTENTDQGYQLNYNNVLSGENQTLNINSGQGFNNVKIYGDAEFVKPIQAPNLTSLESSLSHVNLIGGSNYGENGITSSEYGFEEKYFYVEEGKTYTITGCGMVQNEGSTLWVDVSNATWTENPIVEIKSTSKTIGSTTFTATQTGRFIVQLYAADKTPVTVYWYTICESAIANSFWIPSPADAFDGHYSDNFATEFVRVVNNAGILSNDNFNSGCYLNTGIYYTQNNNVMASVTNSPVQIAGYIEVINTEYNVNAPVSGTGMIFQKVVTVQGAIYTRVCLNTSSGLVWSQWENVMGAQNTNMIALRAVGQGVTNLVIENNNLKNENRVLGKQVVDLTLNNQKTNEQVKVLAKTIIEMQLNK